MLRQSVFGRTLTSVFSLLPRRFSELAITLTRFGETRLSYGVRRGAYARVLQNMGDDVIIFPGVYIYKPEFVSIGNRVSLHEFTYIHAYASAPVVIGDNVLVAKGCSINSAQHRFDIPGRSIRDSGETYSKIVIEDNVWLGFHVCIMAGVTIGQSSVVGAGAVVTRDIPPNSVAVGVPAQRIRAAETSVFSESSKC